jgi:hypothetical protein
VWTLFHAARVSINIVVLPAAHGRWSSSDVSERRSCRGWLKNIDKQLRAEGGSGDMLQSHSLL